MDVSNNLLGIHDNLPLLTASDLTLGLLVRSFVLNTLAALRAKREIVRDSLIS